MNSRILLERLKALHPQSIDLSLDRIKRLLADLGNPDQRLAPVVHVAGTNGKGSSIAFLRAIAEAIGKRVQSYTSPHLIDFHERILLPGPNGGAPIDERALVNCLMRAEAANRGELITHFEVTTAAAFLAFAEAEADILLLETGLGGRLDATNVIDRPLITAITPISIDHVNFLGNTLSSIAREKAGILKPGVPCVVAEQDPEALTVIQSTAHSVGSPLHIFGHNYCVSEMERKITFQTPSHTFEFPRPCLKGRHQIGNAGLAVSVAKLVFGDALTDHAVSRGLTSAKWPARFERLTSGQLSAYAGEGIEIWLDGGHNPGGAKVVANVVAEFSDRALRPFHLIWGMIETKDARAVIEPFKGLVERVYTVTIPDEPNSFLATTLAEIAAAEGFSVTAAKSLQHALLLSQAAFRRAGRVLILGSLYLAGHALKLHGNGIQFSADSFFPERQLVAST